MTVQKEFFQHQMSLVESDQIGRGTRIWAFAHILPGARIGADCNICDYVFIENDVILGDRVTVKCGVQLWDGIRVGDDVFIGPNATFTNDTFPRSKEHPDKFVRTEISNGASVGANATILPGVTLGTKCMVGAGAVVTRSVPPHAIVTGNPARILRYVADAEGPTPTQAFSGESKWDSRVAGVSLETFPTIRDLRGNLNARELGKGLPFVPQRFFVISDVPTKEIRGEHAHRECHQLLVALHGSVSCVVDDGLRRAEYLLDSPEKGLHVPPMVWASQYRYTDDCVLLVMASHPYDPRDYIRSYDEYIRAVESGGGG